MKHSKNYNIITDTDLAKAEQQAKAMVERLRAQRTPYLKRKYPNYPLYTEWSSSDNAEHGFVVWWYA